MRRPFPLKNKWLHNAGTRKNAEPIEERPPILIKSRILFQEIKIPFKKIDVLVKKKMKQKKHQYLDNNILSYYHQSNSINL
jgi:hypothetical protein